jgi:hypothetical protein
MRSIKAELGITQLSEPLNMLGDASIHAIAELELGS